MSGTRIILHADRLTTEPTSFAAEREATLEPGEVCFSMFPFPSQADSDEVVIKGTVDQIRELAMSIYGFMDDFEDES